MKKQIILILSVFSLLILNSCSSISDSDVTISVTNQTHEEFQIRVMAAGSNISEIVPVSVDAMHSEVFNYRTIEDSDAAPLIANHDIYVYHPVDSVYMLLAINSGIKNYKYMKETYYCTGYNNKFYTWDVELEIIIDDAMLNAMTKDTVLTNRIFGLE